MKVNNNISFLLLLLFLAAPVVFAEDVEAGEEETKENVCNVCGGGPDGTSSSSSSNYNIIGDPTAVVIYEIEDGAIQNDIIQSTCRQAQDYVKFRKITSTDAFCEYMVQIAIDSCMCVTPQGELVVSSITYVPSYQASMGEDSEAPSFTGSTFPSMAASSSYVPSWEAVSTSPSMGEDSEAPSFTYSTFPSMAASYTSSYVPSLEAVSTSPSMRENTETPSFILSTFPSMSASSTFVPSYANNGGTTGNTPPINDRCFTATKIEFNNNYDNSEDEYFNGSSIYYGGRNITVEVEGTTVNATYDSELLTSCDQDRNESTRGVWYTFEAATGEVNISMVRADAPFGIAFFYGSGYCGSQLRCYGTTYESWYGVYTRAGQPFYLMIYGREPDSVINSFSLKLTSVPSPTPPPSPTPAPTPPPATMSDQCETALAIPSLPYTVSGSTQGASSDFPINSCGVTTSNSSVWFQLNGTGRAVNATIGYVYGTITILSGDSCGFQDCVGYQTGYEQSYYSRRLASYTWIAEQDTTYYIRVSGNDNNVLYRFTLQVFEYDTPANDDCNGAELVSSFPSTTRGTTRGSLTDFGLPTCGLSSTSRGVWYRIPGNGKVMRANAVAEFSSGIRLALFSGECGFLICRNDQASVQYQSHSSVDWFTEEGRDDYLLVTGYDEEEVGDFQVSFSFSEPPVNNQCNNATLIPGGSGTAAAKPYVDRGTTIGSFPDMSSVLCGDSLVGGRGVWYKFIGEGKVASVIFTLSVGGSTSSYGVASVFSGDCDFLTCVQRGSSSSYRPGSSLDWVAENGTTYLILVTGQGFQYVGPYSFSLVQREAPSNEACQNPLQITSMPFRSVGTIAGATISTPDCSSSSYASRGVWYSFEGSGKWVRSTLVLTYDTDYRSGYVNVFTGMCDFLECEAMATTDSRGGYVHKNWFAQANTTYYIMVTDGDSGSSSWLPSVGNFELQLTEFLPPANDKCENATSFTLLPSVLSGAMRGATPALEFPACGVEPSSPGIWYSVVGTGKSSKFEVSMSPDTTSLSGSNSYPSYVDIAVFSGSSCDELDCVRNNKVYTSSSSLNNGPHPSVDWFAANDVTYRVLVAWDQWVQGGNLKARITDFDPPSNSDCNSATNIVNLPFTEIGNTEGSSENYLSSTCGYSYSTNSSTRGVWYSLTGSGRNITASLRGYFNTQISVFTGSCQTFNCVAFARRTSELTSSAEVTWTGTPYISYRIYVSGQDFSDTGKYQLKVVGIGPETVAVKLKGTAFSFSSANIFP